MTDMPKEIYVWVQSPPNREPYFVADACPFPAAPECTRYIRADIHAAEATEIERLRVEAERWDYAIRFPWVFCDAYKKAPASDISITQAIDAALAKDP